MAGLPPSVMAGLPPSVMAALPPSVMAGLPPSVMAALPPSVMAALPPSVMAGLPPLICRRQQDCLIHPLKGSCQVNNGNAQIEVPAGKIGAVLVPDNKIEPG
jgi:hypothetical protein